MKTIDIYQVDAFTDQPFCGNPAGVVPDASGLTDKDMLNIAREMALSETAFVFPGKEGEYAREVRFFTPTEEVDLCGHATIATFYLLAQLDQFESDQEVLKIKQKTKAGILDIEILFKENKPHYVLMEQAQPQHLWTINNMEELYNMCQISEGDHFYSESLSTPKVYSTGLPDVILPVKNLDTLKALEPDMKLLATFSRNNDMAGLHAFTIEDETVYARNFAPAYDIDEEAATGTANGALISYLYDHGYFKDEHIGEINVYQGDFMGRPSRIYARICEEEGVKKVQVGGRAAVVLKGRMWL